jgi:hypothetical protein
MTDEIDRYDVESIATDKAREAKWDAINHADAEVDRLETYVRDALRDLRDHLDGLERTLNSRTEHLV